MEPGRSSRHASCHARRRASRRGLGSGFGSQSRRRALGECHRPGEQHTASSPVRRQSKRFQRRSPKSCPSALGADGDAEIPSPALRFQHSAPFECWACVVDVFTETLPGLSTNRAQSYFWSCFGTLWDYRHRRSAPLPEGLGLAAGLQGSPACRYVGDSLGCSAVVGVSGFRFGRRWKAPCATVLGDVRHTRGTLVGPR